ncbi:DNA recombination protein RmuC [bacterium BFN5]|nr:DNA recombination protein RmuC [bacterium BFN5]
MEFLLVGLCVINFILILGILFFQFRMSNQRKEWKMGICGIEKFLERIEKLLQDELAKSRLETGLNAKGLREEVFNALNRLNESVLRRMSENTTTQMQQLESFAKQLSHLTQSNEQRMDKLRDVVEGRLKAIQQDNTTKLEEMRNTVDEKLNVTLEKRLGESFRLVSERLELVHKGLGEMQTLALGVGDLKRVLTNVKTRGIWGEMQLGSLLEQILTIEQYAQNIATKPGSSERVEFAIKLPGRAKDGDVVWLPIDAKFPQEDYQRLLDAQEQGDFSLAEEAAKSLETRMKNEAKNIASKYISVPATTDFAILFLPTEGLYAEVLRRPGLCDVLMREYKVIVTGPTTLAALLNSLQMGFRTLVIEKRSSEVWNILGAVKSEFGKFGDLLDKTHKKLQEASNSIDTAARKTRTITRKLKDVEELPQEEALSILGTASIREELDNCD